MIRLGMVLLALWATLGSAAAEPCGSIAGLESLLQPKTVLLLGELHGTVESPAFALDVACQAVQAGLPVVVGLELMPTEQGRVDEYLVSDGGAEARKALLAGIIWQRSYQDGRTSAAMLELIDGLRRLRREPASVRVVLFDAPGTSGGQPRERDMARNLGRAIAEAPDGFTVVLTGNLHSRTTTGSPRNRDYEPMGYLVARGAPGAKVISLDVGHGGGSAWICAPDCGIVELSGSHGDSSWSIEIDEATRPAGHQGRYHVGEISASPPASSPDSKAPKPAKSEPRRSVAPETPVDPGAAPAPGGKRLQGEDPKIDGSWQAHDFSSMAKTWKMELRGSSFRAEGGGDDWYVGEIAVYPDEDPAWIDFRIRDCICSFKDTTSQGIYFWDGDSMVISAPRPGEPRPTRFVQSSGQMMRLLRSKD